MIGVVLQKCLTNADYLSISLFLFHDSSYKVVLCSCNFKLERLLRTRSLAIVIGTRRSSEKCKRALLIM